jgi:hypothetical protein
MAMSPKGSIRSRLGLSVTGSDCGLTQTPPTSNSKARTRFVSAIWIIMGQINAKVRGYDNPR